MRYAHGIESYHVDMEEVYFQECKFTRMLVMYLRKPLERWMLVVHTCGISHRRYNFVMYCIALSDCRLN